MDVVPYALMTYGLTAVISFAVVAIIVVIGKFMGKNSEETEEEGSEDA